MKSQTKLEFSVYTLLNEVISLHTTSLPNYNLKEVCGTSVALLQSDLYCDKIFTRVCSSLSNHVPFKG